MHGEWRARIPRRAAREALGFERLVICTVPRFTCIYSTLFYICSAQGRRKWRSHTRHARAGRAPSYIVSRYHETIMISGSLPARQWREYAFCSPPPQVYRCLNFSYDSAVHSGILPSEIATRFPSHVRKRSSNRTHILTFLCSYGTTKVFRRMDQISCQDIFKCPVHLRSGTVARWTISFCILCSIVREHAG